MTVSASSRLQYARSPAGEPIAECELDPGDTGLLAELASAPRRHGARRLCAYSTADLSGAGLAAREGHRRFTASAAPAGPPLPVLDPATVANLWPPARSSASGDITSWSRPTTRPPAMRSSSGCPGGDGWLGLCRAEPGRRHVDGPGFAGGPGDPQGAQALVLGACARLGPGPVTLETWGDRAGPYLALGFSLAEECPGWELDLAGPAGSGGAG